MAGASPAHVAIAVALSFLPYATLLVTDVSDAQGLQRLSIGLALATGAILVAAPSLLSDDLYRYLWDGRVSGHGIDPYLYTPDDPAHFGLRDALHRRVNNPEIPTIYPPVAQLFFWLADRVDHAPWTLKALGLGAHVLTIPIVARLAGPTRAARASLLYGLNPLALTEAALGGHADVMAGLALAAFALALVKGRTGSAVLLAAAATGIKLVGLAVAPLIALRDRRAAGVAALLSIAIAAPIFFAGHGSDAVSGIGHYARRWQGNAGLYTVIESSARVVVDRVADVGWNAEGHIRLKALAPVVAALEGGPLDPWATQVTEKKESPDRTDFQRTYVASMLARGVCLGLVVLLVIFIVRSEVPPLPATRWVILAVLLLSPQLHPWYLAWLLPLEVASGHRAGLVLSATVVAAYAPLAAWLRDRSSVEVPAIAVVIHLPVLVLAALEAFPLRSGRPIWPWVAEPGLGKIQ
jgi:hypothetical protein